MGANRDAYVNKLRAKLDEWNADIDKLEAQARRRAGSCSVTCL